MTYFSRPSSASRTTRCWCHICSEVAPSTTKGSISEWMDISEPVPTLLSDWLMWEILTRSKRHSSPPYSATAENCVKRMWEILVVPAPGGRNAGVVVEPRLKALVILLGATSFAPCHICRRKRSLGGRWFNKTTYPRQLTIQLYHMKETIIEQASKNRRTVTKI